MKLSIIVPVYNMAAEGKLKFCMDSLMRQTISDYEVIAVDDASTDNSLEILREYEKEDPAKVRVITYPVNRRQGGAKNEGLKAAAGEWIGFVDSDDWVAPECYEKLLRRAEETGADMVGCDYSLVDRHTFDVGKVIRSNSEEQTGTLSKEKHGRLLQRTGSMVVKIYRGQVLRENRLKFPEGIFYEDNCAGPVWSLYFKQFERVEEPLYYYYQHEMSTVHYISEEKCRDRMKAAIMLYEECMDRGFLDEYYQELEYRFTELFYVNTLFSYMQGIKHPRISFIRELRKGILERFPRFFENQYYKENTGKEEQRLIGLQLKQDLCFFVYYRLQLLARSLRK